MLLLSLAAIWLLFIGVVYQSYVSAWKSAGAFARNVEALISLDIARNIDLYDRSLKAAAEEFSHSAVSALPAKSRTKTLFDWANDESGFASISVFDKTGALVANSRDERPAFHSAANQDYFKVHLDQAAPRSLYIGRPSKGYLQDDVWTIVLSRRLEDADGGFAGAAVGAVKLSYFTNLFNAVDMPAGSNITLVRSDGTLLMRAPLVMIGDNLNESEVYRNMVRLQSGEMTNLSSVDGVNRLYHFGYIDHLPIMLIVGIPGRHFLAAWRIISIALGFAVLSIFILMLAVALGRELRRRTLAERELLVLATTDGMTGLANRRHFDEVLEREWVRAAREGTSVALIMVDNDFFKAYNDNYGHLQGDEALKAVSGLMRRVVRRPADLIARLGGEEFAVLLPGTDLTGALHVAETLRQAVSALAWDHVRSPFRHLTVSVGVAACRPAADRQGLSLVEAADTALYQAKELGRNRVVANESGSRPELLLRLSA